MLELRGGTMSFKPVVCSQCHLTEPNDWCWEHSIDCPLDKPPRDITPEELWRELVALRRRVAQLEQQPRFPTLAESNCGAER